MKKLLCYSLAMFACLAANSARAEGATFNFSATPIYVGEADLDHGGTVRLESMALSAGGTWKLNEASSLGVQLQWAQDDWNFAQATAFGRAPWGKVTRMGVALPFGMALSPEWRINVTPTIGVAAESGADTAESVVGGLNVGAFKIFGPGKVLGFGLAGFSELESFKVFPFVIIDWRLAEHWRLANPLTVGPTGPAGLELSYTGLEGFDIGVGGAWRSFRFRLAEDNPSQAGGIGEANMVPLFARIGYRSKSFWEVDLWGGVTMGSGYSLRSANDSKLLEEDAELAPLIAATLRLRF